MSTTYQYPKVAVDGDKMTLMGGKHPETILYMDWKTEVPEIRKVLFGGMEIPYEQVDLMFEFSPKNKTANLIIWNKVEDVSG
jgi:hypothetical protein